MPRFSSPPRTRTAPTFSDLLDRLDGVEAEGDGYVALCPAHTDSRPSLRVAFNADGGKVLLACRAGCTTADVLHELDLTMSDLFDVEPGTVDVRATTAPVLGLDVADRAALMGYLDRAASYPGPRGSEGAAQAYAERRFGIDGATFARLGLGFDDGTLAAGALTLSPAMYHDAPRMVVPFRAFDGRPHYLQSRALVDGARAKWSGPNNPTAGSWGKYGVFEGGTGWSEVIVTEGPGDALTACAVGYDALGIRGAGLGGNAALADELAEGLRGRRVVIAGDADAAGASFTREVARALSERGVEVRRLALPEAAGKDVSEWRERAGAAFSTAFVRAVQESQRYGADEITAEEIAQDLTRLFSDVYNARALREVITEQGADVRYTSAVGFVVYRPELGTWEVDEAEWTRSQAQTVAARVQGAILESMGGMDGRIAAVSDPDTRAQLGKLVDAQRKKARSGQLVSYVMSSRGIDAMIRELRVLPGVFASYEDFDQHPHLLACANGVIDLETGELAPYTPETKGLYLMRRVALPYDPHARCPRWEDFVEQVFEGHAGLPGFMRRLVGYGITGHTTEQCLAVLYGEGANGKGVLLETLTGVFKGVTVTTPFSTFEKKPSGGIPNDIAALKGSRLVMASEGDQGSPMAEALIKRLTGGDTISARFMRKEFFEFVPTFLILLATNYRPNFRGQDFGLWRRVKLVPFTNTFGPDDPRRDRHLTAKFLGHRVPASAWREGEDFGDGAAGILAWAVRGSVEWHERGLEEPTDVSKATAAFKSSSDALSEFYAEHLVKEEGAKIKGSEVWSLYREWADDEGLPSKDRWGRNTFLAALEERGATKYQSGGSVAFRGIRRRRPTEPIPGVPEHVETPGEHHAGVSDASPATPFV